MNTKKRTKSTVVDLAKQLIAGASKHLGSTMQVMLVGGSFTPAQITTKLQQIVTLREGVDAAKAATKARLASETADMTELRIFMDAFVTFVKAAFGSKPDVLADFGIHPKTRATPTARTKAGATVKRAATREARHTMGPKAKLAIKGDVKSVDLVPVATPEPKVSTPNTPTTGPTASPPAGKAGGSTPNAS